MRPNTPEAGPQDLGVQAISPPLYLSTTFEREPNGAPPKGYVYGRLGHPNREALEVAMAEVEQGESAFAFASGMAAISALLQALNPGDHILIPHISYHGLRALLEQHFIRWGLSFTAVDMTDLDAVKKAIKPVSKMLWVETPANPMLTVLDLKALSQLAAQHHLLSVVDNTVATPFLQKPFTHGYDLIVHSTTKALGGHGDAMGGVVIAQKEGAITQRLRVIQSLGGAILSPFDSWLILRGLKTASLRVHAQSTSALAIAQFLQKHPKVEKVWYPGLPDHPGHHIAARQMRAFGSLLAMQVVGDAASALEVASKVAIFRHATSFGSIESLIEHRRSIEEPGNDTPSNLLRLSIGLESPEDLIADLRRALG